jgi:hypothetical protein
VPLKRELNLLVQAWHRASDFARRSRHALDCTRPPAESGLEGAASTQPVASFLSAPSEPNIASKGDSFPDANAGSWNRAV